MGQIDRKEKTLMIVTWCDADKIVNYGQVLQSCAMAKTFGRLGYKKVILVSYREKGYNLKELYQYLYLHHSSRVPTHNSYVATRHFIQEIMEQSKVEFHQMFWKKSVERIAREADVLVCGSDQIWHPLEYNEVMLLDIGREDAIRVSYAASQPMKQMYAEYRKIFKKMEPYLKKFHAISVREAGTVSMFEKMSGRPVVNVVDPTLLITKDEWEKHMDPIKVPRQYILMYIPAQMNKNAKDIMEYLRYKTKINHVICLAPRCKEKIEGVHNISAVSTGQFLYLVKNASYICTSSFHGVIFSVLFEKEFWCFRWMFIDRRGDLRLPQITEWAGLERRLIRSAREIDLDDKIDYQVVKEKLEKHIADSYNFINTNL